MYKFYRGEFNMSIYQCICGKTFDNAQKFNGHKSHCVTHQLSKYGNVKLCSAED